MKVLLVICALVSTLYYGNAQESTCTTPDGTTGICKPIHDCPHLLEMAANFRKAAPGERRIISRALRERNCGFINRTPQVCCSNCYTPNGDLGLIRDIEQCPHLKSRLNSKTVEGIAYVRNSRIAEQSTNVCCGPDSPVDPKPWYDCNSKITSFPPPTHSRCCGIDTYAATRIVGGNATNIDEYPWLVLLEHLKEGQTKFYCGGSLISNRYVVTAAHCITGRDAWPPVKVRLGEYNIKNEGADCVTVETAQDCTDPPLSVPIESILVHPGYNKANNKNDIALIRLKETVPFTDFIRPICLPSSDISNQNQPQPIDLIVAGWGRVNNTVSRSNTKQAVRVPFVDMESCDAVFPQQGLWEGQICAGGVAGKDSCTGDSGGPLMSVGGAAHVVLAGIVSYGPNRCGSHALPAVYTHVWQYTPWILRNLRP